jgi:hypothetical protein
MGNLVQDFQSEGIYTTYVLIEAMDFITSLRTSAAVMNSSFF